MPETGGRGLRALAWMGALSLVAIAAWVYEHSTRTSHIARTWPADGSDAYATIDHTAPWSLPWTKLCRIDADTHAERWCRSVPDGTEVRDVVLREGDVVVTLDIGPWRLDPETGENRAR